MATRYQFGDNYIPHFVTFSVVQWVDALTRPQYKNIVVNSLKYCIDNKDLKLHAWVIMSNHVHLIISSPNDNALPGIMRDFKKYTSKQILTALKHPAESRRSWMLWLFSSAGKANTNNTEFQFWQQDNHPIVLNDGKIMQQKLDYIHDNPVRAGIVPEPQYYLYSSAADYYNYAAGLLPLELLV